MLTEVTRALIKEAYKQAKEIGDSWLHVGETYFHWTHDHMAVTEPRHLSGEEISAKYDITSTMGGGFYVSKNPYEWQTYGDKLFVVEVSKPCRFLDLSMLCSLFPTSVEITVEDILEALGENIPGFGDLKRKGLVRLQQDGFSMLQHSKFLRGEYNFIHPGSFTIRPLQATEIERLMLTSPTLFAEENSWVATPDYLMEHTGSYLARRAQAVKDAQKKIVQMVTLLHPIDFIRYLSRSFEFIDYHHLLHVFTVANDDSYMFSHEKFGGIFTHEKGLNLMSHPWGRYGQGKLLAPLRWIATIEEGQRRYNHLMTHTYGQERAKQLFGLLYWLNEELSPEFQHVRDDNIDAGGALGFDGRPLPYGAGALTGNYPFRGSQRDVDALMQNPFLIPRDVQDFTLASHEMTETDGTPVIPPKAPFLLRYTYPHVANYDELIKKTEFVKYLGEYRTEFELKRNALDWNNTIEVSKLNQALLSHLAISVLADESLSPLQRYQYLVSIHPFVDGNGRTIRAFYQIMTDKPMFMRNWNLDIFCSETDLMHEQSILAMIKEAFERELDVASREHRLPRFYDIPVLWYAMTNETLGLFNAYSRDIHHLTHGVHHIKNVFRTSETFVEKQLPYDLEQKVINQIPLLQASSMPTCNYGPNFFQPAPMHYSSPTQAPVPKV